jgi:hypothetical protein
MAEILKALAVAPSIATTLPSHNHMIGPDLTAGELLGPLDACYIATNGLVYRAINSQANAAAAIADVQQVQIQGNPSGGTYELQYGGNQPGPNQTPPQVTTPLAYNANAAAIQAALVALPAIGTGGIVVSGAYPSFTLTAAGANVGLELEQFIADPSLLVPAGTPNANPATINVIHTTVGEATGTGVVMQQGRVRGFAPIRVLPGQPVTLYDAFIGGYSDQLLTPGTDYYLSAITPGGLTDVNPLPSATLSKPIAFAMDNTRVYFQAND